jgi:hypothetical protein
VRECYTCEYFNKEAKLCDLYELKPKRVCSYDDECETYKYINNDIYQQNTKRVVVRWVKKI